MEKTTTASASNRRRSQRRKPRSTVRVECRRGSTGLGNNLALIVLDLSDSGVRMVVSQQLGSGAEVEVLLTGYTLKQPLKRLANVRWEIKAENGSFCVGLEFQKAIPYRDWQNLASPS